MSASIALPPAVTFPHASYYSVQPFLAWCLNHYVYSQTHYAYCSRYFLPHRNLNPKSSHPYEIFNDLYKPAVDHDPHDAYVQQKRLNIRRAAINIIHSGHPLARRAKDVSDICDLINSLFFLPVVYLVNKAVATAPGRLTLAGSALAGSDETLIKDLQEHEFTLMISDYDRESWFAAEAEKFLNDHFVNSSGTLDPDGAIDQLLLW
jgi:hypothetical protein